MKKAQMKIQQMAFTLMAIALFIVLAGLFILTIKLSGLKQVATDIEEKNALLAITRLANSPEFSCGSSFGTGKISCIDADKVMMLRDRIVYKNFWGVAEMKIRRTYPRSQDIECDLTNYPNCNLINIYSRGINSKSEDLSNFVTLCRKESFGGESYNKCELARILISYESRK